MLASEDDLYRGHGWWLQISFWDGTTFGRRGSPPGSYEVRGALKQWFSDFEQARRRTPTICDSGSPFAPVADPTDEATEVVLDSPMSGRALEVLAPLVMRAGAPAQRADGSTVLAALDRRATFADASGLVTDASWLYWGIDWRFHSGDEPRAWGIMRVAKGGGRPELMAAFENPGAALLPPVEGHHSYRLLGVDEAGYYLHENVGLYCRLLWRLPQRVPVVSAVRHYAYWFNTDHRSFYVLEGGRIIRRTAGRKIDLGPLSPSEHHPTSDGRYLYRYRGDVIWRVSLEGGKRIRLAPMREDVETNSPLKLDARFVYFYRYSSGPSFYFFRAPKSGGKTERLFPIGPTRPVDFVVTDRWLCWCAQGTSLGVYCGDQERGAATRVSPSRCAAIATDDQFVYWLDDLEGVVAKRRLPSR
jgi:hypothetical protein